MKTLLLPGYVRATKGYHRVVALFPALVQAYGPLLLRISGGFKPRTHREYKVDFLSAISKSPLKNCIQFDNQFIDKQSYTNSFKSADLVVLPYEAGSYEDGFKNAAKYGKPIVCSDLAGLVRLSLTYKAATVVASEDALFEAILKSLKRLR